MNQRFPKSKRLRKSWEYQNVWRMGCKYHTPHFILLTCTNQLEQSRLGMTVSRKVGSAVERNRVKRQLREFFRTRSAVFKNSFDLSVVAKKGSAQLPPQELHAELQRALVRNGLLDD